MKKIEDVLNKLYEKLNNKIANTEIDLKREIQYNQQLSILYKLTNSSIIYTSGKSYSLTLPSGYSVMSLCYIGGAPNFVTQNTGTFVASVKLINKNNKQKDNLFFEIPNTNKLEKTIDLDCYSIGIDDNVYNYVDYANKIYVQNVFKIPMTSLTYKYNSTGEYFYTDSSSWPDGYKKRLKNSPILLSGSAYTAGTAKSISGMSSANEKTVYYDSSDGNILRIKNSNVDVELSDYLTTFRNSFKDIYLYYQVENPVERDITNILNGNNFLQNIDISDVSKIEFIQNDAVFSKESEFKVPYKILLGKMN